MANIGTPFVFVNPERYGDHSLSSFPQLARSKLSRAATDFPRFSWLPYKVRQKIIRVAIEEASEYWKDWHEERDNPVMLQSRRGVLRRRLQYRQPPSLPQLACVSTEWEDEIEKKLFKTLRLRALPYRRSDDASDLVAFSKIVTGPRRQYLVELKLISYRKYPAYRRNGSGNAELYRTGGNYQSIVRLFQILGSWDHEHVRNDLLKVILDIELQDFSLHHLLEEIRTLPNIPVIGALEINMESDEFSKLPLALPFLLGKLPQLELAQLHLNPRCLSNKNDKDLEVQVLADGLRFCSPRLMHLEIDIPFIYRHPQRLGIPNDILGGRRVTSIRNLSYRLEVLKLTTSIDLSLFFEHFVDVGESLQFTTRPSWPALEILWLQGSIAQGTATKREQPEDHFLKYVGRATRNMPKLLSALVEVEPPPGSGSEDDQMVIVFVHQPLMVAQNEAEQFLLTIHNHTPSSAAVNAWKEAHMDTKGLRLAVRFSPAVSVDESGEPRERSWHTWEE